VGQGNANQPALQPAADLDAALDIARQLFGGGADAAAESDFRKGYKKASPFPFTDATEIPSVESKKY
jgi:hypothetical protein